ncbi:hypothetical protein J6P92_03190 [bacterium]|nr:hypothetical protein [bacterium]
MNKTLILGTVLFIIVTAFFETKDLLSYIENRSAYSKTPSQMEMSAPLNRKNVEADSLNFQRNTENIHDNFRKENQKKQQNNFNKINKNPNNNFYHSR